jgi:hypothetical protein
MLEARHHNFLGTVVNGESNLFLCPLLVSMEPAAPKINIGAHAPRPQPEVSPFGVQWPG